MNLTPSDQIMYNVVHITMLDNLKKAIGTATGFLFGFCECEKGSILSLVTNRHVLAGCSFIRVSFTCEKEDHTPDIGNLLHLEIETSRTILHPNNSIDLAILPLSEAFSAARSLGRELYYSRFTFENIPSEQEWADFSAIEKVVMAGFPKGLRDEFNNQPITRSGITATHPRLDFRGTPEFLIDMPCFEGCSGSPVLICDEGLVVDKRNGKVAVGSRMKLLGIQHAIPLDEIKGYLATVPAADMILAPIVQSYLNLGFIIRSTELYAFERILRVRLNFDASSN